MDGENRGQIGYSPSATFGDFSRFHEMLLSGSVHVLSCRHRSPLLDVH